MLYETKANKKITNKLNKEKIKKIREKNSSKKEQGITLIALVTTIVVLLILASITIGALTGEGETEVTIDEIDYGYFVKFLDSGRIYKVSRDGDVEYLGKEEDLLTQANIIANPESNTTPEFMQTVELTVETPINIGNVNFMLVSAWSQDKNTAPADSEFQVATLQGDGRRRTTTVNSSASVEGDYYLWVRVVVGEIEKEECFGPYAIKDSTTLVATSSETASTSSFLGMPIERGQIQNIEIKNTLVGAGHSLGDGNTYDVTDGSKGKYLGWYEQNENGYYDVTIAGLEYLDTGLVADMSYMFRSSKVLELDVNSFNTENVTNLTNTFNNCSNLTKLDLNNWDTSSVTSLFGTFQGCTNLKILEISDWNTSNVTEMGETVGGWSYGGTFQNCTNLIELDLSKWDTSEVTAMGNMFNGCSGLTELNLSNFDTSNVTSMGGMFFNCNGMIELNVSNFNTINVTNMGSMFESCNNIKELNLERFNTNQVTNIAKMFFRCNNLTELNINSFSIGNVTDLNDMFTGTPSNIEVITNIDTETWLKEKFPNLTNIHQ